MSTLSGIAQQVVNQNRQRLANPISISHQREFTYSINLHHDTRSDNLRRSPFKALRNQLIHGKPAFLHRQLASPGRDNKCKSPTSRFSWSS
jgi:hypothetical protein